MKITLSVVAALLALTACSAAPSTTEEPSATPSVSEAAVESEPPTPTPEPEPTPDPDGTYTSSCDYLLGGGGGEGYRFVADAEIKNTGNIGTVFELKATWFLAGGDKIVERERVRVKAGRSKRAGISVDATGDQIDAHQAVDGDCKTSVAMVDVFGEPS